MSASLYVGTVTHWRRGAVEHAFQYPISYCWIDLAAYQQDPDMQRLLSGPWRPWAFRPGDHGPRQPVAGETFWEGSLPARQIAARIAATRTVDTLTTWLWSVAAEWGVPLGGRICCLTQLRSWGYGFSPLNLFYLYDRSDREVVAVVGEVTNTPWGERHWYVLPINAGTLTPETERSTATVTHPKEFHVSPFWDLDLHYRWLIGLPADELHLSITSQRGRETVFGASLALRQIRLNSWRLWRRSLINYRVLAGIYWQALRLWWKKCRTFPHPHKAHPNVTAPIVTGPPRNIATLNR